MSGKRGRGRLQLTIENTVMEERTRHGKSVIHCHQVCKERGDVFGAPLSLTSPHEINGKAKNKIFPYLKLNSTDYNIN